MNDIQKLLITLAAKLFIKSVQDKLNEVDNAEMKAAEKAGIFLAATLAASTIENDMLDKGPNLPSYNDESKDRVLYVMQSILDDMVIPTLDSPFGRIRRTISPDTIENLTDIERDILGNNNWRTDDTPCEVGEAVMLSDVPPILYLATSEGKTLYNGETGEEIDALVAKYSFKKAIVLEKGLEFIFKCFHCSSPHLADTKIKFEHTDEIFYVEDQYLTSFVELPIN